MADCHSLFTVFHRRIKLTTSKEDYLRTSRDALRTCICKHFSEEEEISEPRFHMQGSFAMRTIVNPLDGEYDLDDGVYLTHVADLSNNVAEWEITPHKAHALIASAVAEQTDAPVSDKPRCVRVTYANDYHVDLPVYLEFQEVPYLADTGEMGWHPNDARAIVEWFREKAHTPDEQLTRMVRLLKAWADAVSRDMEMPSGLILTVLTVDDYVARDRDDLAFSNLVEGIARRLEEDQRVPNPKDEAEDLSVGHEAELQFLALRLGNLLKDARAATETESTRQACELWGGQFGERFPSCNDLPETDLPKKTKGPALLRDDFRSA